MVTRTTNRKTTTMVPVHRRHSAMIHIVPALIIRTRVLRRHPRRHHHQQWEDTLEKVQHNLLCGHTTRTNQSFKRATSMCLFFCFNHLRHVRVSRRKYVPLFGTYSHMPFQVLVVCFNYLRHVRFTPGPLYPSLVYVITCHFMCCVC